MKKKFVIEGIDCANCASKMEEAINKIEGVNSATINFFAEKLTIDADDDKFEDIIVQAEKACNKVDRGVTIKR
ncbi:cation transporter [Howardella ureilytica]|nr:cation transporter [Lachnospiraceae bacterium]MDY2956025.1 cation transporter [Lachnospiraceae bacterium]